MLRRADEARDLATGAVIGTIDLIYRDEEGSLVVADYKTDAIGIANTDAEIAARAEVYISQGRAYVETVHAFFGERPRFELWFLAADRAHSLTI